jgi:hypothetical protein
VKTEFVHYFNAYRFIQVENTLDTLGNVV